MAIRHCVELGYHRSTECYRRNADTLTKEMLKRCFWVAYDIDRVAAFILGRPVGIPEDSIDVELPMDIDDEHITPAGFSCSPRTSSNDTPTAMTGALHVIRLRRLWAKFNDSLYSKTSRFTGDNQTKTVVEGLRAELEEWRASLPSQLDFAHSNPLSVFASSEWFRIAYDHSILLLYRPFITSTEQRENDPSVLLSLAEMHDEEMVERAFDECARCAREMCLLYRRLYQSSSIQFTWGSLHILFLGGLTYLYCLWRSRRVREKTRRTDVVSTCLACSTVLVIIAERWNLATSYRDLFEALSEKTKSAWSAVMKICRIHHEHRGGWRAPLRILYYRSGLTMGWMIWLFRKNPNGWCRNSCKGCPNSQMTRSLRLIPTILCHSRRATQILHLSRISFIISH
ncbi:fungal-specific transcription factor domain-containing protein [Aspergillus spectabilis]